MAWHQAAFTAQASVGKLPSWESVLEKLRPPVERQDVKTLATMVGQVASAYGLKLIKRKRKRTA